MKKKTGFTLAEVLISLTIIGVIAAITVPALIQRTNKQEYVTALQKAYSTLSQVTNQIIAENGSPKADENGASWADTVENLFSTYKKYLYKIKDCGYDKSECFAPLYKNSAGNKDPWMTNAAKKDSYTRKLVLQDGTSVMFVFRSNKCSSSDTWHGTKNACAHILVDLNGVKKPNQWGRDVFSFTIKENGLVPSGCDRKWCLPSEGGSYDIGYGCACKVLREGAVNY